MYSNIHVANGKDSLLDYFLETSANYLVELSEIPAITIFLG